MPGIDRLRRAEPQGEPPASGGAWPFRLRGSHGGRRFLPLAPGLPRDRFHTRSPLAGGSHSDRRPRGRQGPRAGLWRLRDGKKAIGSARGNGRLSQRGPHGLRCAEGDPGPRRTLGPRGLRRLRPGRSAGSRPAPPRTRRDRTNLRRGP